MLVEKHQKRVFNIAYRMLGHYEEANDIAQEAFIAAFKGIKKFEEKAKFSTWLYAIVINISKNRIRQLKSLRSKEQLTLDDPILTSEGQILAEPSSNDPSILESMEKKEIQERVQACIGALDADFREVIVLRDLQGLTYEEIGEILKIAEGTVKSRLFRAREQIRSCLEKVMEDY